jgi:two-component system chemotaxis response regulator CheB
MTADGKITVLVVDDSALARSMLRSALEGDGDFAVVAEAENGRQAVELCASLRPDLITMDLEMPVMGGLAAIEEIMCTKARPILVVSGVADAEKAFAAVAKGAIEVVEKPNMASPKEVDDFIDKARLVSKIPVITMPRTKASPAMPAPAPTPAAAPSGPSRRIIAIASSTGGPQALAVLLGRLPAALACPVVVAQHISDGFAPGMAHWLNGVSPLAVRLAAEGEVLAAGTVYLAPSETNMAVTPDRRIRLEPRRDNQVYRPCCDTLLKSVAQAAGDQAIGLIMTGMGSDGVAGMQAIQQAGGTTLGQDEASSVIFGMNAVAIEKGHVGRVLALNDLAPLLDRLARGEPLP